jgi:hypothetical protein
MFTLILTIVVLSLSGYFFWRFHAAFPTLRWRWKLAVAAALVAISTARFWERVASRLGSEVLAEIGKAAAVTWMVMLFWFALVSLVLLAWSGLAWGIGLVWPAARRLRPGARRRFLACCVIVLVASVWGWVEAYNVSIKRVRIEVDRMPPGREVLRIAQISDVHVGSFYSRQRLERAARLLDELDADVIVCTGDLVDGELDRTNHMADSLAAVDAPLGKYAIFGNHEFYSGEADSTTFTRNAGFRILRQEVVQPIPGLVIVGVDDPTGLRRGGQAKVDELPVLPPAGDPNAALVILLKHRPEVEPRAVGRFDVQLSGHTHGGQVFPFGFMTAWSHDYATGFYELAEGSSIYVSRGTGTWGSPFRLMSPPEVTLIELRARQ